MPTETSKRDQTILLQLASNIEKIAHSIENINVRLGRIDERFNQMDERFNQMDERFNQMDERFNQMDKNLNLVNESLSSRISMIRKDMLIFNAKILRLDKNVDNVKDIERIHSLKLENLITQP